MSLPEVSFSCVVLGEESLALQCCEELQNRGHCVLAVVTDNRRFIEWCERQNIAHCGHFNELRDVADYDYLFSVTNLKILPDWLLAKPLKCAINFHDGPLPAYAGLNAPVWALINNEADHGVTWHEMQAAADAGSMLVKRHFAIAPGETAFSLNTKCYQAGLESFAELIERIEAGTLQPQAQDFAARSYFGLAHRPEAAALLDWRRAAGELNCLIKALDYGPYPNPVMLPKIDLGHTFLLAREAAIVDSSGHAPAGTIEDFCATTLTLRCADTSLKIVKVTDRHGGVVDVGATLRARGLNRGDVLPLLEAGSAAHLTEQIAAVCRHEKFWHQRLRQMESVELPFALKTAAAAADYAWRVIALPEGVITASRATSVVAVFALLFSRLSGKSTFSIGYTGFAAAAWPKPYAPFFESVTPLPISVAAELPFAGLLQNIEVAIADSEQKTGYLSDLRAREPDLKAIPACANLSVRIVRQRILDEGDARAIEAGAALNIVVPEHGDQLGLLFNRGAIDDNGVQRLLANLHELCESLLQQPDAAVGTLNIITEDEQRQLERFNATASGGARDVCVHQLFERQAALTPARAACLFEGTTLSYQQLNASANQLARYLQSQGVKPGDLVGVMVERSLEMLVALYAVHKAGCAYVPLDPIYPRDRLAYMVEDAELRYVITQRAFVDFMAIPSPIVLDEIAPALQAISPTNIDVPADPRDLAYVIYTSGSTGKPKGVMVEHGNVVNFFVGMDQRLETEPGTWLAVTSISFDISVLELFWTLARGFTIVLYADNRRQKVIAPQTVGNGATQRIEFGFFYWNVATDASENDQHKYKLLLEGAKFADSHGFNSVWTPERHFAAFGGLFPNPSVTCAALATITQKVALRAGSCVVPLHSPIRIAEEWAVVDNLSNGRVGLSIAAGWAPPDFAIKPENFANAKQVMFDSIDIVKRLWRGETVHFPGPGGDVPVRTLPRPLQKELPLWVTTAGNIDTFIQAAQRGDNVLTHLLGQTVDEVRDKVLAYRQAWRAAGHPGEGIVTLMLHTFVGPDAQAVERVVRQPLKDYLKSAMFLVKAAAWNFPTFKKMSDEQGKTLDEFFASISAEDMDGLLEYAFQRYFHSSGLFGTPESCMAMVDRVSAAGVNEIACLIDFGIATDTVLEHLPYLDQLRETAQHIDVAPAESDGSNAPASIEDDFSLPALLSRHRITHFQCTPSMATMLVADASARAGLAGLKQIMVGGEAFPSELARTLKSCVRGRVTNMYGPTETTIWSAIDDVEGGPGNNVSIGRPLANQRVYILDDQQQPLPIGLPGELVIGGEGVVRGYWRRPELTAEKFLRDPFNTGEQARMYRTGDLARYLPDGRIECLGRVDHQVKIRGYRVELGEIEAQLRAHADVLEAAVLLREDVPGDQRLVAYVRPMVAGGMRPDSLREFLKGYLPEFMVPSAYVEVAAMPLTPNGKLDRKALPPPRLDTGAPQAQPQNEMEALLLDIWKRALGVAHVGTRDNFFDVGGHSLLIVQVLKELRERVTKPIQMTDLFKYTTIEAIAKFLAGSGDGSDEPLNRSKGRAEMRRAAMTRRRG